jgi:hypothetical protein
MLALWFCTFALTLSPELHRWFHEDADSSTHACLVTQIRHHSLLTGFVPVVAPSPVLAQPAPLPLREVQILPTGDYRLSPSRAPPLISSIAVA